MDVLLDHGMANIEAQIKKLDSRMVDGLLEMGYKLQTPIEEERRSFVNVVVPDPAGTSKKLREEGISVSSRWGGLRVAPNFYNTEAEVDIFLEKLDKADLVNRVRSLIISELASGTISKNGIADQLHMSPRSLQLKLAAKGTTFQDTLDKTRQTLAQGYMTQSSLTITEIAYLLGFADSSNFTRAFKRWTGQPPSKFRDHLDNNPG